MSGVGEDYEYDEDREGVPCPKCLGDGSIDCHCGGDLCVCENYGERDCPVCHGEGDVSEERYAQYEESRRQFWATVLPPPPNGED